MLRVMESGGRSLHIALDSLRSIVVKTVSDAASLIFLDLLDLRNLIRL